MKTIKWYAVTALLASLMSGQYVAAMESFASNDPMHYAEHEEGDGAEHFLDVVQRVSPIPDQGERDEAYDEVDDLQEDGENKRAENGPIEEQRLKERNRAIGVGAAKARKRGEKRKGSHLCEECGDELYSKTNLTRHKKIHTGEKKHVCTHDGCGKAFSRTDTLKDHIRRHHTDEMPYACRGECGSKFNDRANRWSHEAICELGQKALLQKPLALKKNPLAIKKKPLVLKQKSSALAAPVFQESRSQQESFDCVECSMGFPTQKSLIGHNIRKHKLCGPAFIQGRDLNGGAQV